MPETLKDTRRCLLLTCAHGHPWSIQKEHTELHDPQHQEDPHDLLRAAAEIGLMVNLGYVVHTLPHKEASERFAVYDPASRNSCPDCQRLTDAHHRLGLTLESALTRTEPSLPAEPPVKMLDDDLHDLLISLAGAHPAYDLNDLRRALAARQL